MENKDYEPEEPPEVPPDAGTSLGYGQGIEYQHLNVPTQPLPVVRLEKRHRQEQSEAALPGVTPVATTVVIRPISIGNAALLISGALIASRALGLLRSSLFTLVFKPGAVSDAYVQASLVPDLIFNIVTGGALLSAFIPVFNKYLIGERDEKTAWHVASSALNLATVLMLIVAVVVMIFARPIVALYNYGVSASQLDLITSLTRIMLLQAVIMGAGVIVSAVLNARQNFLLPSIGSVLYSLGSIFGLLPGVVLILLHQRNDNVAVYCAIWGIVFGSVLLVGVQIPGLMKLHMRYRFSFDWHHGGIVQIARQMVPRVINALMLNMSTAVDRVLILFLMVAVGANIVQGLLTQYVLAFSLVLLPLSAVMAVATAAFPTMTEYVALGRIDRFRAIVSETLRSILFVSIPASIGLILLAFPLIQALYEHGRFSLNDARSMSVPLMCFALGLPGLAAIEILTRSFYALRSSTIPVVVSVAQFIGKIVLSILLMSPALWLAKLFSASLTQHTFTGAKLAGAWGMGALAFATSVAVLVEAATLLWLLHRNVGGLQLRLLSLFAVRVLAASLPMCLGLLVTYKLLDMVLVTTSGDGTASLGIVGICFAVVKVLASVAIGSFIYLRVARFIQLLDAEKLGPVHRLLIRLRLAWI